MSFNNISLIIFPHSYNQICQHPIIILPVQFPMALFLIMSVSQHNYIYCTLKVNNCDCFNIELEDHTFLLDYYHYQKHKGWIVVSLTQISI